MNKAQYDLFLKLVHLDDERRDALKKIELYRNDILSYEKKKELLFTRIKEAEATVFDLKKNIETAELQAQTIDAERIKKQKLLTNAATPKDFFALTSQTEALEKESLLIDEQLLLLWPERDKAQADYALIEKTAHTELEECATLLKQTKQRILELEKEYINLSLERDQLAPTVEKELYQRYETMKQKVPNPVVRVSKDSCSACFNHLTAQELNLLFGPELIQCKDCYRLLYMLT
jgi:predicted  nucleic acid-binding Zn-ribbon protein